MRTICVSSKDSIPVKYDGDVVGRAYVQKDCTMMVVLDTKEDEIKSILRGSYKSMSIEIARNNI